MEICKGLFEQMQRAGWQDLVGSTDYTTSAPMLGERMCFQGSQHPGWQVSGYLQCVFYKMGGLHIFVHILSFLIHCPMEIPPNYLS